MKTFAFNPLIGNLFAEYSGDANKSTPEERSKILGFHWLADDNSEAYFFGLDGISQNFPDIENDTRLLEVPIYARRELLRVFWEYKGRSPRVRARELSLNDALSIIEYYFRTLVGDDLSEFKLFGVLPVSVNRRTMAIKEDGLLAEASRRETDGFFNQRRPRDAEGRHFSIGAAVRFHKDGAELAGEVVSRQLDRVTVSISEKRNIDLAASDIHIYRSKGRKSMKHNLKVGAPSPGGRIMKKTFRSFISANKDEIYKKAAEGGVTIMEQDGYSADAMLPSTRQFPLYQIYTPQGDSLGIYYDKTGANLDDVVSAHLATTLFTEW